MKPEYKAFIHFFAFTAISILLSNFSFFVRNYLLTNFENKNFGFFCIEFVKNTGAAFSLFQTHTNLLILISIPILIAVLIYVIKNIKNIDLSMLLLLSFFSAGISCNLIERIFDGYVTDYIRLTFVSFPIFNLSDMFINVAAFFIICNILFKNEKRES